MITVRSMVTPASPLNFQELCSSTIKGPTNPVKIWNWSQDCMVPQRAFRLRLRKEYNVSANSINTKPRIPIRCPKRLLAAGMARYQTTINVYTAVIMIAANKESQSSLLLCCMNFLLFPECRPEIHNDLPQYVTRL